MAALLGEIAWLCGPLCHRFPVVSVYANYLPTKKMVKLCFSRGLFLLVFELRPRQALWQISALVYSKLAKARQHNPVHLSLNALLGPVHLAT